MENNEIIVQEEAGISFNDLFFLIKKNLVMIMIITFLFTLAGGIYGFGFKSYTYTSTATAIVYGENNSNNPYQDVLTAQYMINTFKDYITSNVVAKDVMSSDSCKDYNLDIKHIQENLSVSTQTTNSLVLTIKYKAASEKEAITVLNQILDSTEFLSNQTEQLKDIFIVMDRAEEVSTVGSRGAAMVIIICFIIGALLSCGIVLIKFLMDDTYTSKEAIEKHYNINVIASLPNIIDVVGGSK